MSGAKSGECGKKTLAIFLSLYYNKYTKVICKERYVHE